MPKLRTKAFQLADRAQPYATHVGARWALMLNGGAPPAGLDLTTADSIISLNSTISRLAHRRLDFPDVGIFGTQEPLGGRNGCYILWEVYRYLQYQTGDRCTLAFSFNSTLQLGGRFREWNAGEVADYILRAGVFVDTRWRVCQTAKATGNNTTSLTYLLSRSGAPLKEGKYILHRGSFYGFPLQGREKKIE